MDGKKSTRANRFMNKFAYPTPARKDAIVASNDANKAVDDPLRVSGGLKDVDENCVDKQSNPKYVEITMAN